MSHGYPPDQRQQLRVCQSRSSWRATALPRTIAVHADRQHPAQRRQRILLDLLVEPGNTSQQVLREVCRRFFAISSPICSRLFPALRRDSSICSGVTGFAPAPLSLLDASVFTRFRSVCSDMPSFRATTAKPEPSLTRWTAANLNSAVYDCFGTLNIPDSFLSVEFIHDLSEGEISGEAHQCGCCKQEAARWSAKFGGPSDICRDGRRN
jgi:hypothetical protein